MEAQQTEIQETPIVEVPVTVESAPVVETKSYEYQPTDDAGRPLGGKQVLKYTTSEELIEKMQEQNVLLLRRLRAETKKNRLGISDTDEISSESPRYQTPVEFTPRQLTPDERVALSRDLLDPERFEQAKDTLFESAIGVKTEDLRKTLTTLQEDNLRFKAKQESDAFVASNPGYHKCTENFEAITNWMIRYNLAPVRENFQKAYDTLLSHGVLVESGAPQAPVVPVVPVAPAPIEPVPSVVEPVAIIEPVVPKVAEPVASFIPSGLTREDSTDAVAPRPAGDDITFETTRGNQRVILRGVQALNAMPADVYKHRVLNEPGFAKKADRALAEAEERAKHRGR